MAQGQGVDYVVLEAHMNATAKLQVAREAITDALEASKYAATLLEAQARDARIERRQTRGR